jgi:hypothetical protein
MARKRFATVNSAAVESFAYTPPEQAYNAARILVKPNLAPRPEAPGVVSAAVLGSVLRGLRRAAPVGRIVIVESGFQAQSAADLFEALKIQPLLDQEMRLADVAQMVMSEYPASETPFTAPEAIADYDCLISVATLEMTPFVSGSLHNWIGFLPSSSADHMSLATPRGLRRLSEAFGAHIDGGVIVVGKRVLWSDDITALDKEACRLAGVPMYEISSGE